MRDMRRRFVDMAVFLFCFVSLFVVCYGDVDAFVERHLAQLELNSEEWVYSGCNMYWLGLDENCEPPDAPGECIHYPSHYRIDDAIQTAKGMGMNVIRAHTLGISTGNKSNGLALHPNLTTFNDKAFDTIDYSIASAKREGIRLIVPLTDNWNYFHGGYHDFVNWRGFDCDPFHGVPQPSSGCYQFFTNPTIINDFFNYVTHLLNHTNKYTGLPLKFEPTILAWETGNELSIKGQPFANWTNALASHIKTTIGAKQLVMDGRNEKSFGVDIDALKNDMVDLVTDHYYVSNWQSIIPTMINNGNKSQVYNKVFTVGEYGPAPYTIEEVHPFLVAIENEASTSGLPLISGDNWWSLFSHGSMYGFVEHNDSYTLHWPGETVLHQQLMQGLRIHAFTKRGLPVPSTFPVPQAPNMTWARVFSNSSIQLAWRGAAMACNYTIQKTITMAPQKWKTICDSCVTDMQAPWWDTSSSNNSNNKNKKQAAFQPLENDLPFYRIAGHSCDGVMGPFSSPISVDVENYIK
eukprot:m.85555 g.85555  ORF g.85555 m.85555 type:complete len:520 (+) comp8746_c2_seq2:173-1732(+)